MKSFSLNRCAALVAMTPLLVAAPIFQAPALAEDITLRDAAGRQKVLTIPDAKNPWLTGICSFIIPGLGQFVNGDWGWGLVHLGLNVLLFSAQANSISSSSESGILAMRMGLNVWSTWDAAATSNRMTSNHDQISRYLRNYDGALAALPDRISTVDELSYIRSVPSGLPSLSQPPVAAPTPVFINNVITPAGVSQPANTYPASAPSGSQGLNLSDPDVYYDSGMGMWRRHSNNHAFWDAASKTWIVK